MRRPEYSVVAVHQFDDESSRRRFRATRRQTDGHREVGELVRVDDLRASGQRALLHVAFDGTATELGLYPSLPDFAALTSDCELDAFDRLYCRGQYVSGRNAGLRFVARFSLGASESEPVLDGAARSLIARESELVTGP